MSYNVSNEASELMEGMKQMNERKLSSALDELKKKLTLTLDKVNQDQMTLKEFGKREKRNAYAELEESLASLDSAVNIPSHFFLLPFKPNKKKNICLNFFF